MKKILDRLGMPVQPRPNILVSSRYNGEDNALAVAVAMNCSIKPPMVVVGIVPSRYSYNMIKESGVFIINLVTKSLEKQYKYLGSTSRRFEDKLKVIGMKTKDGTKVDAPILLDCPVNAECVIVESVRTGSHELFIARVECIHVEEEFLNDKGMIDYNLLDLI